MKIFIKVKPKSKVEKIEKISETNYIVAVKEPPVDGKANKAICRALAGYFKKPLSQVVIKTGHIGKNKIIEVL